MTQKLAHSLQRAALLTLALTCWTLAAAAEDVAPGTITVKTVRPASEAAVDDPATAAKTVQHELQIFVSYADLDLATSSGVTTLRARVEQAARTGCRDLDRARPFADPDLSCPRQAVRDAESQVEAAIAAARRQPG
jgi:UrcA family protein